jgi:predicted nucleotidyltransferase component of viral defense system
MHQDLQRATIAALIRSRRWAPGDLAFRGGTCLHLVHGCVRFSQDLDFLIRDGVPMDKLPEQVAARLDLGTRLPADSRVDVTGVDAGGRPHTFDVTLSVAAGVGSARVKVALWQTDAAVLRELAIVVGAVQDLSGNPTAVPAITRSEALADKVYALGARVSFKPCDIYDLWWLSGESPQTDRPELTQAALARRLAICPTDPGAADRQADACQTAGRWLKTAQARLAQLGQSGVAQAVATDLRRWLPSIVAMDAGRAATMLTAAGQALRQGIDFMAAFVERSCQGHDDGRPEPARKRPE